jgi:hypothetical protein
MEDDDESNDDEEEDDAKVGTVYKVGPKGRVKVLPGGVGDVSFHLLFAAAKYALTGVHFV